MLRQHIPFAPPVMARRSAGHPVEAGNALAGEDVSQSCGQRCGVTGMARMEFILRPRPRADRGGGP